MDKRVEYFTRLLADIDRLMQTISDGLDLDPDKAVDPDIEPLLKETNRRFEKHTLMEIQHLDEMLGGLRDVLVKEIKENAK